MNLGETLLEALKVQEITLPRGAYLRLAADLKMDMGPQADLPLRAYCTTSGRGFETITVPDSFTFAGPNGWVTIREGK